MNITSPTPSFSRITAATVRQKPRVTGDQFIAALIEEPVKLRSANFIKWSEEEEKKTCYVGKPRGKLAYLQLDSKMVRRRLSVSGEGFGHHNSGSIKRTRFHTMGGSQ